MLLNGMKQEDKNLLLRDLCARLPYGVKVLYEDGVFDIDYISSIKILEQRANIDGNKISEYVSIPITPAKLKNAASGAPEFTETAKGGENTYTYTDGRWVCETHKYTDPSDTVCDICGSATAILIPPSIAVINISLPPPTVGILPVVPFWLPLVSSS